MYQWFFNKNKGEIRSHLLENIRFDESLEEKRKHPVLKEIISLAENNGMRGQELKALIAQLDDTLLITPNNDRERFSLLHKMITILNDDHFLNTGEKDFCTDYGVYLGYERINVVYLIRAIMDGMKLDQSEEEIWRHLQEKKEE